MSRTFRTVGSGASQTTEPIENNKIPVYETKAAAEADIANLSDGQIIGTKDEGNENAKPVDVVEKGNMHAVTSNAVAENIQSTKNYVYGSKNLIRIGDIGIFTWKNTTTRTLDLSQTFDQILNVQITPESWGGDYTNFYVTNTFTPSEIAIAVSSEVARSKNLQWLVIGHLKEGWVDPTL